MRNFIGLLITLMIVTSACGNQNTQNTEVQMDKPYIFILGTYTENEGEGINLVKFDPLQERLEVLAVASDIENPSFVISNKKENLVFATEETGGDQGGKVTSYRLDKSTFTLERIGSVYTKGDSPCHLSLDPSEKFLIVSNYSGGNLTAIPVDEKGMLSQDVHVIQHEGKSINPRRQQAPHVHSAVFHPQEKKVFVANLGTDKVMAYDFDQNSSNPLVPSEKGSFDVAAGSGPRHMAFNKEGDRIYVIHELTGEIGVYGYENGEVSHLETHTLIPEDFSGDVGAAEVRISPDGNFLYASNRGEVNNITVFQIEEAGLSKIQDMPSQGIAPRNFAITPDGKYLLCGNQNSDEIVVFNRNQRNGHLEPTSISLSVKKPVYFYFLD
ncbi:MAG TPA: lactonase family protein [Cyclobacteriaceae bacterium]|nr:lactonase family protein [Cyclobacteriaceae bacterium]